MHFLLHYMWYGLQIKAVWSLMWLSMEAEMLFASGEAPNERAGEGRWCNRLQCIYAESNDATFR